LPFFVSTISDDVLELASGLGSQGDAKGRYATALSQVIGALVVRYEDKQPVSPDPWFTLASKASEYLPDTLWPLRTLLFALEEKIASDAHRDQMGGAARKLLEAALSRTDGAGNLTAPAIGFVATTYASDVTASRALLRQLFEPGRFRNHGDQEIPWLARKLAPIAKVDPDFVVEVYAAAFSGKILDDSSTSLGNSQILPLTSNRRQDYDHALWTSISASGPVRSSTSSSTSAAETAPPADTKVASTP
jgi:hypothetical protein